MNTKMKARIALTAYWLAIGFLVACAGVIVFKLMFWPLCTPAAQVPRALSISFRFLAL